MDNDLESMSREQLITEVRKLRDGIRKHRDSSGHDLCWHHPKLWSLLPEKSDPVPVVPGWSQFMDGCIRFERLLMNRRLLRCGRRRHSRTTMPNHSLNRTARRLADVRFGPFVLVSVCTTNDHHFFFH